MPKDEDVKGSQKGHSNDDDNQVPKKSAAPMLGDEILDGPSDGNDEKNRKGAQKNQEPGEKTLGLSLHEKLLQ